MVSPGPKLIGLAVLAAMLLPGLVGAALCRAGEISTFDAGIQVESAEISPDGRTAFLTGWRDGINWAGPHIQAIDLTDPAHPVRVGWISTPANSGSVNGLRLVGSRLYAAGTIDGLLVFDVSDPAQMVFLGSYSSGFNSTHRVDVSPDGEFVYLGAGDYGLKILDSSGDRDPVLLGEYDMPDSECKIGGVSVFHGNCSAGLVARLPGSPLVFVPMAWGGLHVVDVSNPSLPALERVVDTQSDLATRVAFSPDLYTAYVTGNGVQFLDITTPTDPIPIGGVNNVGGFINDIIASTQGGRLFLGTSGSGLAIADVSNVQTPCVYESYSPGGGVSDIAASADESLGLVAAGGTLHIVDWSQIGDPVDTDADRFVDQCDNCPTVVNADQGDRDEDGIGDTCDPCDYSTATRTDTDQNGIEDVCECGDQSGDGRVDVVDLVAINLAIFNPARVTPLCDTNNDQRCDVRDIVGANMKIFGRPAYCSRFPPPAP